MAPKINSRWKASYDITEEEIRYAMSETKSLMAAARFLGITLSAFKKYSSMYIDAETGKTLTDLHKNQSQKGVPKSTRHLQKLWDSYLEKKIKNEKRVNKDSVFIEQLIKEGYIIGKCALCGFSESRVIDGKYPFTLDRIDGDDKNNQLDNLRLLCFNHMFLIGGRIYHQKLPGNRKPKEIDNEDDPSIWLAKL